MSGPLWVIIIQKKCLLNSLYFWKNNNLISMLGRFLCFLFILSLGLFHIEKISSTFWMSISWSKERWGPDTHYSPHQRGALSKAEQPLFVQKNHFKIYPKCLNLWLDQISNHSLSYKLSYLMKLNIRVGQKKMRLANFK